VFLCCQGRSATRFRTLLCLPEATRDNFVYAAKCGVYKRDHPGGQNGNPLWNPKRRQGGVNMRRILNYAVLFLVLLFPSFALADSQQFLTYISTWDEYHPNFDANFNVVSTSFESEIRWTTHRRGRLPLAIFSPAPWRDIFSLRGPERAASWAAARGWAVDYPSRSRRSRWPNSCPRKPSCP
jgi:hypothetical protein